MTEEVGILDRFSQKLISRKFLVWGMATIFMLFSLFTKFKVLESGDWVIVSAIYIGSEAVIDAVVAMRGNKQLSQVGQIAQTVATSNVSSSLSSSNNSNIYSSEIVKGTIFDLQNVLSGSK